MVKYIPSCLTNIDLGHLICGTDSLGFVFSVPFSPAGFILFMFPVIVGFLDAVGHSTFSVVAHIAGFAPDAFDADGLFAFTAGSGLVRDRY